MKAADCEWPYVFPGGVPGWVIFGQQVQDIRDMVALAADHPSSYLNELCFVGLIAYFEGFVKYHFGSLINICPKFLTKFAQKRPELTIPLQDISALEDVHMHFGFVVADRFAFSSPKEINSLFRDLIGVTPFSKDEKRTYDASLHDRHQIVHSAGICTVKYLRNRHYPLSPDKQRVYLDSSEINAGKVLDVADFLLRIAEKIVTSSYRKLKDPTVWNSDAEMKARSHHVSFLMWNENAFSQQEDAPTEE